VSSQQVIRCGVDYLTTTWPGEIRDTILGSTRQVMDWARDNAVLNGAGNWVKPWAWQGYNGHSCGPVSCGQRADGCILRLSSTAAHEWLAAGLSAGHNISRIDIAATVWGISDQSALIARHKVDTDTHRKTLQHKPYRVRLIDGVGDGDTLYCGSRESVYWLRIYDKERDPKSTAEYKGSVRYEAELKEELAQQAYSGVTRGGYSVANCVSVLGGLLVRRGIDPIHIGCIQSSYLPNIAVSGSDVSRSLKWIASQVKPTLQNLMRMGYEEEALVALGLDKWWRDYSGST
jgi:hypothetical protein